MSKEEVLSETLSHLVAAMNNCALYSSEHPAVGEFSEQALATMGDLLTDGSFNLAFFAETLLFNDIPVTDKSPHILTLRKKFRLKGVDRLIIRKGVTASEIKRLMSGLATRDEKVSSSQHITVGVFDVTLKSDVELQSRALRLAKTFEEITEMNTLQIHEVEKMIGGFILALREETNLLKLLEPIASHSEYTNVHAINVSMITLYLGETLGLKGEELHDAGIAGMLHDVGKLFIGSEVLHKESGLSDEEWKVMQLHPIKGGLYLSKIPEIPKVAAIAAFEHHMKYDGTGYPRVKWRVKNQHLISSIVAIADFFDAMRSMRVYRKKQEFHIDEILTLIVKGSGNFFHPVLVECFVGALRKL